MSIGEGVKELGGGGGGGKGGGRWRWRGEGLGCRAWRREEDMKK